MLSDFRLNQFDFEPHNILEELPADFACPVCTLVKKEILECSSCQYNACVDCLTAFNKGGQNVHRRIYTCIICKKSQKMNAENLILSAVKASLQFDCKDCEGIFTLEQITDHK
jgi:hypothetical protein